MDTTAQIPEEERDRKGLVEPTDRLYVRHVEDRGLPATVVLPELQEARGSDGPVPIFVP